MITSAFMWASSWLNQTFHVHWTLKAWIFVVIMVAVMVDWFEEPDRASFPPDD